MTSEVPTLIVRLRANAAALDATTAMRTTVVHLREAADALEAQGTELALCKTRARWVQVVVAELNADLDVTEAERDAALATIDEARMRLHAASIPLGMSELAFAEATIRDARAILSRGAADIT